MAQRRLVVVVIVIALVIEARNPSKIDSQDVARPFQAVSPGAFIPV
jgi:hypothetical protein